MSAFGNLSGLGAEYSVHASAMLSNAKQLVELAHGEHKPTAREVAMASIYFGAMRAHLYANPDADRFTEAEYNIAKNAYEKMMRRAGITGMY